MSLIDNIRGGSGARPAASLPQAPAIAKRLELAQSELDDLERVHGDAAAPVDEGPVPLPRDWRRHVQAPQSEAELAALRKCVARGTPFGSESWQRATAERLGLEASLHPRGRPRYPKEK